MKKVITLHQPWASLVAMGIKKVETRSWKTGYRGELLIHASQSITKEGLALSRHPKVKLDFYHLPVGQIIGSVKLDNVVKSADWLFCAKVSKAHKEAKRESLLGDLSGNRFAWDLTNPVLFKQPVPARGFQKLWSFRQCRECGCSEFDPCFYHSIVETCHWVEEDLCSHCANKLPGIVRRYQTFVNPTK
jgi:hypothetical protein